MSYPTMSPLSQWGHSPETAHRLLTPPPLFPCCVHQCRGSSGRHTSVLIPHYRFESFLHEAVLQALPSLHASRDSTSSLFVDCCVSFVLTTQALGLHTPSTSSLLVEKLLSPVFFFWFETLLTGLCNLQGSFCLALIWWNSSAAIVQNGVT